MDRPTDQHIFLQRCEDASKNSPGWWFYRLSSPTGHCPKRRKKKKREKKIKREEEGGIRRKKIEEVEAEWQKRKLE